MSAKREYIPRPCRVCSEPASFAFSVLGRSVGFGQNQRVRAMKLSASVLLCERCSKNSSTYVVPLTAAASESIKHVRKHRTTVKV
jgi:hypothetical protein